MSVPTATDRLRRIVVVAIVLILLGAGSAAAYWTAQAWLDGRATAAQIGIEQSLLPADAPSPLAGAYSAESLELAGPVSITNTGTREATYRLAVQAGAATSPALPAALQVSAAPVAGALDCTPGAAPAGATTGTLGDGITHEGTLDAGATVTICVQTSLSAADHAGLEDGQLELALTSSLEYAKAEQWQVTADQPMTVRQSVVAAPPVRTDDMVCLSDGPWEAVLGFDPEPDHEGKSSVTYRMSIAPAGSPEQRTRLDYGEADGWNTLVRLRNAAPDLTALAAAEGYGNAWLYVEKKFPGDTEWTPAAQGKFHLTDGVPHNSSAMGVYCGWQG